MKTSLETVYSAKKAKAASAILLILVFSQSAAAISGDVIKGVSEWFSNLVIDFYAFILHTFMGDSALLINLIPWSLSNETLGRPVINQGNTLLMAGMVMRWIMPLVIFAILITAIKMMIFSNSPGERAAAKAQLQRLLLALIIVPFSPYFYQMLIDISYQITVSLIGGVIMKDPPPIANPGPPPLTCAEVYDVPDHCYNRIDGLYQQVTTSPDFGKSIASSYKGIGKDNKAYLFSFCCGQIVGLLAVTMIMLRYTIIHLMAIMMPLTCLLYLWDFTKSIGRTFLKYSLTWAMVNVVMAMWVLITGIVMEARPTVESNFTVFAAISLMCMIIISPLIVTGALAMIGAILSGAGQLTPGFAGVAMVGAGQMMQAQSAEAVVAAGLSAGVGSISRLGKKMKKRPGGPKSGKKPGKRPSERRRKWSQTAKRWEQGRVGQAWKTVSGAAGKLGSGALSYGWAGLKGLGMGIGWAATKGLSGLGGSLMRGSVGLLGRGYGLGALIGVAGMAAGAGLWLAGKGAWLAGKGAYYAGYGLGWAGYGIGLGAYYGAGWAKRAGVAVGGYLGHRAMGIAISAGIGLALGGPLGLAIGMGVGLGFGKHVQKAAMWGVGQVRKRGMGMVIGGAIGALAGGPLGMFIGMGIGGALPKTGNMIGRSLLRAAKWSYNAGALGAIGMSGSFVGRNISKMFMGGDEAEQGGLGTSELKSISRRARVGQRAKASRVLSKMPGMKGFAERYQKRTAARRQRWGKWFARQGRMFGVGSGLWSFGRWVGGWGFGLGRGLGETTGGPSSQPSTASQQPKTPFYRSETLVGKSIMGIYNVGAGLSYVASNILGAMASAGVIGTAWGLGKWAMTVQALAIIGTIAGIGGMGAGTLVGLGISAYTVSKVMEVTGIGRAIGQSAQGLGIDSGYNREVMESLGLNSDTTVANLQQAGINTVGDLRNASDSQLLEAVGGASWQDAVQDVGRTDYPGGAMMPSGTAGVNAALQNPATREATLNKIRQRQMQLSARKLGTDPGQLSEGLNTVRGGVRESTFFSGVFDGMSTTGIRDTVTSYRGQDRASSRIGFVLGKAAGIGMDLGVAAAKIAFIHAPMEALKFAATGGLSSFPLGWRLGKMGVRGAWGAGQSVVTAYSARRDGRGTSTTAGSTGSQSRRGGQAGTGGQQQQRPHPRIDAETDRQGAEMAQQMQEAGVSADDFQQFVDTPAGEAPEYGSGGQTASTAYTRALTHDQAVSMNADQNDALKQSTLNHMRANEAQAAEGGAEAQPDQSQQGAPAAGDGQQPTTPEPEAAETSAQQPDTTPSTPEPDATQQPTATSQPAQEPDASQQPTPTSEPAPTASADAGTAQPSETEEGSGPQASQAAPDSEVSGSTGVSPAQEKVGDLGAEMMGEDRAGMQTLKEHMTYMGGFGRQRTKSVGRQLEDMLEDRDESGQIDYGITGGSEDDDRGDE
ncbi:MAG: hypothetical protein GF416_01335 [Candidatus Altiarchaeales archaeon]|nr:hypothetical protein [Candidatus Altiarchaeales archaeon]MBD3415759.1 hypothetical protein [Candidatus Altiarchaeales archaeon]